MGLPNTLSVNRKGLCQVGHYAEVTMYQSSMLSSKSVVPGWDQQKGVLWIV